MFFVKVIREKQINVFTADDFEIYADKVKIYRTMLEDTLEVPLGENDYIYIMDAQGNTLDSLAPKQNE